MKYAGKKPALFHNMRKSRTVAQRERENEGGFVKVESTNGKIFMVNIETQKNEKKTGKGLHLAE
ncbi:MAG: hypothetical protein IIY93_06840, partial [Clostridia bacterium]|nr:hypothetical protein [Clostridia bacterium]